MTDNVTKKQSKLQNFLERNKKSEGYLLKKTVGNFIFRLLRAVLIFGLVFLILQPILNKISFSFMSEKDLYDATVISIPRRFTTANYELTAELMHYWKALINSTWISLLVAILQVFAATLVGYGFARFEFPLKKLWFACVILVIVIPPQTISSSQYLNFRFFDFLGILKLLKREPINLLNSVIPYSMLSVTCMGLKDGLYIYMIRQFFRGIPKELEEAAYVDGCGKLRTFLSIMLPDATPIVTSCFLFAFVWQWTDSFYTKMFLAKYDLLSKMLLGITERLNEYLSSHANVAQASSAYANAMISTGTLMAIVPLIIIYLFAQKGFVESLSQSGIKM